MDNVTELILKIIHEYPQEFSDILLESEGPVMIKTASGWTPYKANPEQSDEPVEFSRTQISLFLDAINLSWINTIHEGGINKPLDLHTCRLRVNAYFAAGNKKLMVVIRKIPTKPLPLTVTGLPAATHLFLDNNSGLILISGATGSGKTTSVASMVEQINEARNNHIITIEDPIEYVFERKKAIFSQREVGVDCLDFQMGVKNAMRQRPDVIVIGEIRDRETAEQALLAGESGALVIATLHASSAVGTLSKLLGFFTSQEHESKLASLQTSLVGIINQVLIPKRSGSGYALASDFFSNAKRENSNLLTMPDRIQALLDSPTQGDTSSGFSISVPKLIRDGLVDKVQAAKVLAGNAAVYEKIRSL
jgi:twitching motility protein PilT